MKKPMVLIAVMGLMLALAVPYATAMAQDAKPRDEAAVYKDWYDANQAKDTAKAFPFAEEYLEKFPSGQYAAYLKKWRFAAYGYFFNEAKKAKNMADELKWGKKALAEDPQNIDYLYLLAYDLRTNEIFANPPNYSHAAEAADFTQRTIALIEGGKLPNGFTADKKNALLAQLTQTIAVIEAKNGNKDKALESFKKSASIDPANNSLNAYSYLQCGVLNQTKYGEASKKFDALPKEQKENPEDANYKAALAEVNAAADAVIECWAKFLALPESSGYGDTRAKVEATVKELWKFRHDDKEDGLTEYINKFKPGAPNGTSSTTK